MDAYTNAVLGVVFLSLGFAAVFLMFKIWGYPFDEEKHEGIRGAVIGSSTLHPLYDPAWRAVKLRFTWAEDACREFEDALCPYNRDRQDKAAFTFFVVGISALETYCFALYSLGSIVRPDTAAAVFSKATRTYGVVRARILS